MPTLAGTDKAAMLLNCLPPLIVAKVLELLGPERSQRVRARMQVMVEIGGTTEGLDGLVKELEVAVNQPTPSPGAASPRLALYRQAAELEDSGEPVVEPPAKKRAKALAELSANVLTAVLNGEQIHVVAMVLNSIPVELAGEVLQRLPPEVRCGVPVCLSRQGATNPELLARITKALLLKAQSSETTLGANDPAARYQKIANMIRTLEKAERNEILGALQEQEPEAAVKVKDLLYQFEDLLRIVDRSMQKVLSEIDSKNLSVALTGASVAITEKVLNNLSTRAREALGEEIELLGVVPQAQVRQAQKTVVDVIQRLDQAGELQMQE